MKKENYTMVYTGFEWCVVDERENDIYVFPDCLDEDIWQSEHDEDCTPIRTLEDVRNLIDFYMEGDFLAFNGEPFDKDWMWRDRINYLFHQNATDEQWDAVAEAAALEAYNYYLA